MTRLVAPKSRGREAQQTKEGGRAITHALECEMQLVEIDNAFPLGGSVKASGVELQPLTTRCERVPCDAMEICGVDEELVLRNAHRQDVCDMVIRNGVTVTIPIDEAIDAANAVDDASGVVRMTRKRNEMLSLVGEALEGGALVPASWVDDFVHPRSELRAHVGDVTERATIEKRALDLPERSFGARLVVRVSTTHRQGSKLVVTRKREEAWIVDGLIALPPKDDGLLAIVFRLPCAALEACEGEHVSIHQGVKVVAREERKELSTAVHENIGQRLNRHALAIRERD